METVIRICCAYGGATYSRTPASVGRGGTPPSGPCRRVVPVPLLVFLPVDRRRSGVDAGTREQRDYCLTPKTPARCRCRRERPQPSLVRGSTPAQPSQARSQAVAAGSVSEQPAAVRTPP